MDLNSVILIGRLTRDAELRYTQSGKSVTNFSIAVNGLKKDEVYFIDCQKWNADNIAKFLTKGKRIGVSGRIEQQRWDKNGQNQSKIIVVVNDLQFLDNVQNTQNNYQQNAQNNYQQKNNVQENLWQNDNQNTWNIQQDTRNIWQDAEVNWQDDIPF